MFRSLALAVAFSVALGVSATTFLGCAATRTPELRVLGVHEEQRREVVFVQVTNPANRPMRLTRLAYVFASAGGATVSEGEVELAREVPAGEAVVVEVPLDAHAPGAVPLTLRGKLTTELDQMVRTFDVSASINPNELVTPTE